VKTSALAVAKTAVGCAAMSEAELTEEVVAVNATAVISDSAQVTDQTFATLNEWLRVIIANHGADILVTAAAIVVIQILRGILTRYVRTMTGLRQDARRSLIVRLRGISIVLTMMVILAIWSSEVRTLTISILALGTISVLAFKELIQCLLGSMVRSGSSSFKVGDRISVDGIRGEVIDISWMHTTVLATGSHLHAITGERVTIPNSVFLTKPIHNFSLGNGYGIQSLEAVS
jgi:small-conductance mechanosensitive channel